jgi:hypothetical protein
MRKWFGIDQDVRFCVPARTQASETEKDFPMKKTVISAVVATFASGMAMAQTATDQIVDDLTGKGFERIEIDNGLAQIKVEAIRGTDKLEVVYDRQTGSILKQEMERVRADEDTTPGVSIRDRDRDFVNLARMDDVSDDDRSDDDRRDRDDDSDDDQRSGPDDSDDDRDNDRDNDRDTDRDDDSDDDVDDDDSDDDDGDDDSDDDSNDDDSDDD